MVAQTLRDAGCEIVIDRSPSPAGWLPEREDRSTTAILAQPGMPRLLAAALAETLPSAGVLELPDGDTAKSLAVVEEAYRFLDELEAGRHATVVGIGGGAATDVAGFVAATWLRGIESVLVPTTLLAAVDASIGGKTGINYAGKNLVGAFWRPSKVVVDLDLLAALPEVVARQGWAEIVKAGFISDVYLTGLIEGHGLKTPLEEAVTRAIAVKLGVVGVDFAEKGERAVLNYGHTIGHALEIAGSLTHGDAVAIGMAAAAAVSERMTGFTERVRHDRIIESLGLPLRAPSVDPDLVWGLLSKDKKRSSEGLRMVLLERIGEPKVSVVAPEDVALGLASVGVR